MQMATAIRVYALFVLLVSARLSADAGEIKLRTKATPAGEVVRVTDLGLVSDASVEDTEWLQSLPLFPTPNAGESIRLDRVELQQLLILNGAEMRDWRITGADAVVIARQTAVKSPVKSPVKTAPAKSPVAKTAAELPQITAEKKPVEKKPIEKVEKPKLLLVAAYRPLTRGDVVKESDVHLIEAEDDRFAGKAFADAQDVIGKEVIRSISVGRPIEQGQVQPLRLVKRGDTVTVKAKAAGVSVTTTAKAMEDGAANDVISVEPTSAKDRILARVTGDKYVEVYAAGPQYPTGANAHSGGRHE